MTSDRGRLSQEITFSLINFGGILLAAPAMQIIAETWSVLPADLSFLEWMWTLILANTLVVSAPQASWEGQPSFGRQAAVTAILPLGGLVVGWLLKALA